MHINMNNSIIFKSYYSRLHPPWVNQQQVVIVIWDKRKMVSIL